MLESQARAHERGFTLLEIVVVIVLIGTLLVVALTRLLNYVEEAERVAVLTLESRLRSALLLETAKRVLDEDDGGVAALAGSNPMRLMLEAPYNYAGELEPDEQHLVGPRRWFFDLAGHQLVYRRGGRLHPPGQQDIRYRVRLAYEDRDGDGAFAAARDDLVGVRLHRMAPRQGGVRGVPPAIKSH